MCYLVNILAIIMTNAAQGAGSTGPAGAKASRAKGRGRPAVSRSMVLAGLDELSAWHPSEQRVSEISAEAMAAVYIAMSRVK